MYQKSTDLYYPETFHRTKRLAMAYCAAVVVLSVAKASQQHITGYLNLEIPLSTAKSLLWVAATYYMVGFVGEYRSTIRLNAQTLADDGPNQLDDRLAHICTTLDAMQKNLNSHLVSADIAEQDMRRIAILDESYIEIAKSDGRKRASDALSLSVGHANLGAGSVLSDEAEVEEALIGAESSLRLQLQVSTKNFLIAFEAAKKARNDAISSAQRINDETSKLRRDLKKLMRSIGRERRFLFHWWELGGATCFYFLASLLSIRSVIDYSIQLWGIAAGAL